MYFNGNRQLTISSPYWNKHNATCYANPKLFIIKAAIEGQSDNALRRNFSPPPISVTITRLERAVRPQSSPRSNCPLSMPTQPKAAHRFFSVLSLSSPRLSLI